MGEQPFDLLLAGEPSLLRTVEELVVDGHRRWYETAGPGEWSEPQAYRWLRYEDPAPVRRLAEGVARLAREIDFDPGAVEHARQMAGRLGYGGGADASSAE